ncbi:type VI secretion system lipoprotein TssJ [Marinimicrobium sp. C6131]|uniref:type VI secretion system lipoprotein TssJ n=1 Tax=Marinimicrobium sp. C6131 TaxID=3022676 RepID=UPI00223D8D2F|nr:type VI secretion system lipoprotein TssJ [Marinimicrobium sp. C6131]UZJ44265.1 type VI secretion system lipoprotein TssJ [Marinimicrobium sp. C6131]
MERFAPLRRFLPALLVCGLAACANQESRVGGMLKLQTDVRLSIDAHADINPDHSNEPAPVVLRLYELTAEQAFADADFVRLYERDSAVLGDTLVRRRQLPGVAPGETRNRELVLDAKTRYVGIMAEFYQYERAAYKVVVPVTARNVFREVIKLKISGNQLSVLN